MSPKRNQHNTKSASRRKKIKNSKSRKLKKGAPKKRAVKIGSHRVGANDDRADLPDVSQVAGPAREGALAHVSVSVRGDAYATASWAPISS